MGGIQHGLRPTFMEGVPEPRFLDLGPVTEKTETKPFKPHVAELPTTGGWLGEVVIDAVDTEQGDLPNVVSRQ